MKGPPNTFPKKPMLHPSENTPPKNRILVVDDHPLFRHGIGDLINAEPDLEVCGEADNAPAGPGDGGYLAARGERDRIIEIDPGRTCEAPIAGALDAR
jgi:hypothetical protein